MSKLSNLLRLIEEESNICDSTLDNSTVPTYEEFTTPSGKKPRGPKSSARRKHHQLQRYLNSTEASCLVTDDESQEDEEDADDSIIDITNSVKRLELVVAKTPTRPLLVLNTPTSAKRRVEATGEYAACYHKLAQTSFPESPPPVVVVIDDSLDEETTEFQLRLSSSSSEPVAEPPPPPPPPPQPPSNVTTRRHKNVRLSIAGSGANKRVSLCGDELTERELRIDETILDESENEEDVMTGRIHTLYESAMEDIDDEPAPSPKQPPQQATTSSLLQVGATRSGKPSSESDKSHRTTEDSSDDKFEKFLSEMRQKAKVPTPKPTLDKKSNRLNNFIVDDSDMSSSSDEAKPKPKKQLGKKRQPAESPSSLEECPSSSDSDEQLFYIKATNKFRKEETVSKPKQKPSRSSLLNDSSSAGSGSESESDSSDDSPPRNRWQHSVASNLNSFKTPSTKISKDWNLRLAKTSQPLVKEKPVPTKYSFVESLSVEVEDESRRDPAVLPFMKKFKNKKIRAELLQECYNKLNAAAFDNQLPAGMKLVWSSRLTSTAVFCRNLTRNQQRSSEIHISAKVNDTPQRMRDTLAHEMCHAATFLINGAIGGHCSIWKSWTHRVNFAFKRIPKITVYHDYEIRKKFTYKCIKCSYQIHRFSKSIDVKKQVCGYCFGTFELIAYKGVDEASGDKETSAEKVPATPRQPSAFSLFVKENYQVIRKENPDAKHQEIMKELGARFKLL